MKHKIFVMHLAGIAAILVLGASISYTYYVLYTVQKVFTESIKELNDTMFEFQNTTHIELSTLDREKENLKFRIDVVEGHVDVLDQAVDIGAKTQAKIDIAVVAIKETLPTADNPHEGCRAKPTQGEMRRIAGAIIKYSEDFAVESSLIMAVMRQESIFCNAAVSPVGAQGYMQLMPETALEIATDLGASLKTWRGRDNIHMGAAYIGTLLADFHGNTELAVRAYNGGPQHVHRVLAGRTQLNTCENGTKTKYYCETELYVQKVLAYKKIYEKLGL